MTACSVIFVEQKWSRKDNCYESIDLDFKLLYILNFECHTWRDHWCSCWKCIILCDLVKYQLLQPRGVMVAQVILVHFVEVRILTGLPFFLPWKRQKKHEACQGFASYRASGASHFAQAQSASCGIAALHFSSRLARWSIVPIYSTIWSISAIAPIWSVCIIRIF